MFAYYHLHGGILHFVVNMDLDMALCPNNTAPMDMDMTPCLCIIAHIDMDMAPCPHITV